jgi:hypothetical protein
MTTATTNSAVTAESHGYPHPGFPMHGFPTPTYQMQNYPMQNYPMTNYSMPAPMYAPPYSHPFVIPGATQANGPAFLMQNYPTVPNHPMPAPMYAPPYGYHNPFAMPAPQAPVDANYGRKRQYSVSNPLDPIIDPIAEAADVGEGDPSVGDWPTGLDTTLEP